MRPVLSLRDLSWRLGTPIERLRAIANNVAPHYTTWVQLEKHKVRHFHVPSDELMEIQRRIKSNVLDPIGFEDGAHGGVRGRSPRTNALQHLAQPCVVNLDVKDFFPSVRHYVVYRMFRYDIGFGHDVARILTRLTTLNSCLPQGTPTSTAIANMLLASPVDRPITDQAKRLKIRYTRFVDDITFSGSNPRPLINAVAQMLSRRRLGMHRKKARWSSKLKLKISSLSVPQEVTGLIVNCDGGPSVSQRRRDKVRAAIFALRKVPGAEIDTAARSIRGRISHVRQFNPGSAARLERYLATTLADAESAITRKEMTYAARLRHLHVVK